MLMLQESDPREAGKKKMRPKQEDSQFPEGSTREAGKGEEAAGFSFSSRE